MACFCFVPGDLMSYEGHGFVDNAHSASADRWSDWSAEEPIPRQRRRNGDRSDTILGLGGGTIPLDVAP